MEGGKRTTGPLTIQEHASGGNTGGERNHRSRTDLRARRVPVQDANEP